MHVDGVPCRLPVSFIENERYVTGLVGEIRCTSMARRKFDNDLNLELSQCEMCFHNATWTTFFVYSTFQGEHSALNIN